MPGLSYEYKAVGKLNWFRDCGPMSNSAGVAASSVTSRVSPAVPRVIPGLVKARAMKPIPIFGGGPIRSPVIPMTAAPLNPVRGTMGPPRGTLNTPTGKSPVMAKIMVPASTLLNTGAVRMGRAVGVQTGFTGKRASVGFAPKKVVMAPADPRLAISRGPDVRRVQIQNFAPGAGRAVPLPTGAALVAARSSDKAARAASMKARGFDQYGRKLGGIGGPFDDIDVKKIATYGAIALGTVMILKMVLGGRKASKTISIG